MIIAKASFCHFVSQLDRSPPQRTLARQCHTVTVFRDLFDSSQVESNTLGKGHAYPELILAKGGLQHRGSWSWANNFTTWSPRSLSSSFIQFHSHLVAIFTWTCSHEMPRVCLCQMQSMLQALSAVQARHLQCQVDKVWRSHKSNIIKLRTMSPYVTICHQQKLCYHVNGLTARKARCSSKRWASTALRPRRPWRWASETPIQSKEVSIRHQNCKEPTELLQGHFWQCRWGCGFALWLNLKAGGQDALKPIGTLYNVFTCVHCKLSVLVLNWWEACWDELLADVRHVHDPGEFQKPWTDLCWYSNVQKSKN